MTSWESLCALRGGEPQSSARREGRSGQQESLVARAEEGEPWSQQLVGSQPTTSPEAVDCRDLAFYLLFFWELRLSVG